MGTPTFSHYHVFERLGSGGMGVVYRAQDTALGRTVALKFLHSREPGQDSLTRFMREARVAASINHPNVCTIHEVGAVPAGEQFIDPTSHESFPAGTPFIAMELLTGETLHDRLTRVGPLPVKELVGIAVQIAEGMQEAHARHVVHRDLKPHNVVVDAAGRVKILDFGLAKPLTQPPADDAVMMDAQTQSAELTRLGGIVGTTAYMSPEQAQGKPLDSRSDLFSFGVLLYELADGNRPFDGDNPTSTLAKILEVEPRPLRDAAPHLPADLDRVVRRCLQKAPAARYQDARDLVLDLKEIQQSVASRLSSAIAQPRQRTTRRIMLGVACTLVGVAAIAAVLIFMRNRTAPAAARITHRQLTFSGTVSTPAISPDGTFMAYHVGDPTQLEERLVVQELTGGQPLDVYKGWHVGDLAWSPDGSELVFNGASTATDETAVQLVPRLGGTPRRLRLRAGPITWSADGARLASARSDSNNINIEDKSSGRTSQIPLDPFTFFDGLHWSPSGRLIAYATSTGYDRSTLWTINVDGTNPLPVVEENLHIRSPRWSAAGDAVYYLRGMWGAASELWKIPVAADGRPSGAAVLVVGGLPLGDSFTLTRDGTRLAYTRTVAYSNLWLATIPSGPSGGQVAVEQLTQGTFSDTRPSLSPDGTRIAFSRRTGERSAIYAMPIDGSRAPLQITFTANADSPSWSPDGTALAFNSNEDGTFRLWTASTTGEPPQVLRGTEVSGQTNLRGSQVEWGPQGTLLYQRPRNRTFHALDPATAREVSLVKDASVGWVFNARYSPDGARVAVYRNLSQPRAQGIWVMSPATGTEEKIYDGYAMPAGWSPDGKWVLALERSTPARVLAIPASGGDARLLANLPWSASGDLNCTTRDGRRFVCAVPQSTSDVWLAEHFDPDVR